MPLSLPSDQAFLWLQQLKEQAAVRNITLVHVAIATRLYVLPEAGEDRITHARLASLLSGAKVARGGGRWWFPAGWKTA